MRKRLLLSIYFLLVVSILGCGYTTRGFLNPDYKSIFVKPVLNKLTFTKETQEYRDFRSIPPLLEDSFTKALISRFNLDGNLRVDREETADLILETEITDFLRETLRYTDQDRVQEYRLKIYFTYKLYDKNNNLIRKKSLVSDTTYTLEGKFAESEDSAISDLLDDAARRIVEDIVEEW